MKNGVVAFVKMTVFISFLGAFGTAWTGENLPQSVPMTLKMVIPIQSSNVDCTCRFQGEDYDLGEAVCIRGQKAVCGRVLNNTSWKFSNDDCLFTSKLNIPVMVSG